MGFRLGSRRPERLTAAERHLLDRLVREVGPRLFAYVLRTYGGHTEAEDIVAETFCRAATNMAVLAACDRQDLYLLTTARNLCRDRFRSRRRNGPLEQLPDGLGRTAEPDEGIVSSERREALLVAVAALPEVQREVVALRLSAGLKFEEIATLLDAPLGTVLSRMHAAVQRLRQELDCVHER